MPSYDKTFCAAKCFNKACDRQITPTVSEWHRKNNKPMSQADFSVNCEDVIVKTSWNKYPDFSLPRDREIFIKTYNGDVWFSIMVRNSFNKEYKFPHARGGVSPDGVLATKVLKVSPRP